MRMPGVTNPRAGRLHDVDDKRDGEQSDLYPMGFRERRILRRHDRSVADALGLAAGQQAVGSGDDPKNDQRHAHEHARVHRHSGQPEARFPAHPEHRQVQRNAGGHHGRTAPEREHVVPSSEQRRFRFIFLWFIRQRRP